MPCITPLSHPYHLFVANSTSFMQLAELAALLFLSEYTHARHLWRRHETAATSSSASSNPELHQFQLLWTAAQPMATHDHAGAYAALDSCIASAEQPLAAYAGEIRKQFQDNVLAKTIEGGYSKISKEICRTMLGYTIQQEGEMTNMLVRGRGWLEKGDFLIPCEDEEKEEEEEEEVEDGDNTAVGAHGDRIRELADMVGFMERSKLNL